MTDDLLLEQFVAAFARHDELIESAPVPPELFRAQTDHGAFKWRPCRQPTDRTALQQIYACTRRPFPALYEKLVLGWRWLEMTALDVRLFANTPAPDLSPLFGELTRDRYPFDVLVEAGLIPFGHGAGLYYDFVCFSEDQTRQNNGPLVKVEHEALLMHGQIEQQAIYASFREFVEAVVRS
jgi:hypothetical protein